MLIYLNFCFRLFAWTQNVKVGLFDHGKNLNPDYLGQNWNHNDLKPLLDYLDKMIIAFYLWNYSLPLGIAQQSKCNVWKCSVISWLRFLITGSQMSFSAQAPYVITFNISVHFVASDDAVRSLMPYGCEKKSCRDRNCKSIFISFTAE